MGRAAGILDADASRVGAKGSAAEGELHPGIAIVSVRGARVLGCIVEGATSRREAARFAALEALLPPKAPGIQRTLGRAGAFWH